MTQPRAVTSRYDDPVDLIWLATAKSLGIDVVRAPDAYASWDGRGTLTIATPAEMDADDCLAQMIFHELCHALVEGPESLTRVDWGLENADNRDAIREHATDRLQAALADRHGLRQFMAVTTDWRAYYDALPADPLAPDNDPATPLAQSAYKAATTGPWSTAIEAALSATAAIAEATQAFAPPDSLWATPRGWHNRRQGETSPAPEPRRGVESMATPDPIPPFWSGRSEFLDHWRRCFPRAVPVARELRWLYSARWSRIHNFADDQRYPDGPADVEHLLRLQNAVANRVLSPGPCYLVQAFLFPYIPSPCDFDFDAAPFKLEGLGQPLGPLDDGDQLTFWTAEVEWQNGGFDELIELVATDVGQPNVLMISKRSGNVWAPYDGGVDVFFRRDARRKRIRLASEFEVQPPRRF